MSEDNSKILTRPLTPDDLDRIVEIDAGIIRRSRPAFFEKRLAAALAEPEYFVYIGFEDDDVLEGYMIARILGGEYGETKKIAVLDIIGVDPYKLSHGIGAGMMEHLKEILKHKGIEIVTTQADWHNVSLLRFLSAAMFEISSIHVLEREIRHDDKELLTVSDEKTDYETEGGEKDYSDPNGDDVDSLARDKIFCRSLKEEDLSALIRIDKKVSGIDHSPYYERKMKEVMNETGVRVSLVAEKNDLIYGFIMARVDYGEFDRTEPVAVLDTFAVDPGMRHHLIGTALLSQLIANLTSLRLETIRTVVNSDHFDILQFLMRSGFKNSQRLSFSYKLQ